MEQIFKSITVEMKDPTNGGLSVPTTGVGKDDGNFRLKDSQKYFAVKLDGTTASKKHMGVLATAGTDAVIGVVGDTFDKAEVGTKVVVQGIVPMVATAAAIAIGDGIAVSAKGKVIKAVAGSYKIGLAMSTCSTTDGTVDVLLTIGAEKLA